MKYISNAQLANYGILNSVMNDKFAAFLTSCGGDLNCKEYNVCGGIATILIN